MIKRIELTLPSFYNAVRSRMLYLHAYHQSETEQAIRRFMMNSILSMTSLMGIFILIFILGQASALLIIISILLPGMIPFLKLKQLDRQIKLMKRQIIMELPVFLNKLTLLVNAGETIQKAMIRCASKYELITDHPFAREMNLMTKQLSNLYPLAQILDEFSRRCGVQEVSVFASAVSMNHKRGGEEFVASLRQLSHELWEKRKTMVKMLGEEASGKMVFPLLVIFLVVMIIVGAPAIMLMG
ncbi:MAG: type II secretion system F family protein [Paenibacillaceae bacterium]